MENVHRQTLAQIQDISQDQMLKLGLFAVFLYVVNFILVLYLLDPLSDKKNVACQNLYYILYMKKELYIGWADFENVSRSNVYDLIYFIPFCKPLHTLV